ncbi:GIY-YIG nuclease family protein [Propionibacterium sp.]|uniref:GIY-YIG nuclease family protein n=1 Tax=Propionibacterium sp. TaxID=1977903 RepID=UPI0039E8EB4E
MAAAHELRWWSLDGATSVAPLLAVKDRRGIYVLEFRNGERYVGKATTANGRFSSHRHGSAHHTPWPDIVAFGFMPVNEGPLDQAEHAMIIQQCSQGHKLRNKVWNIGHDQPAPLDKIVSIEVQKHWATGSPTYDLEPFVEAARREPGAIPKLCTAHAGKEILENGQSAAEAVIGLLAQVVSQVIPSAVELEERYWTLSDYPQTARGRFATLTVGPLEIAVFPRFFRMDKDGHEVTNGKLFSFLNAAPGTFISAEDREEDEDAEWFQETDGHPAVFSYVHGNYKLTPVDRIAFELGAFTLDDFSEEEITGMRKLVIDVMRNSTAMLNSRHHSHELARRVYEQIVEQAADSGEDLSCKRNLVAPNLGRSDRHGKHAPTFGG